MHSGGGGGLCIGLYSASSMHNYSIIAQVIITIMASVYKEIRPHLVGETTKREGMEQLEEGQESIYSFIF